MGIFCECDCIDGDSDKNASFSPELFYIKQSPLHYTNNSSNVGIRVNNSSVRRELTYGY